MKKDDPNAYARLGKAVKTLANAAVNSSNPVNALVGTVKTAQPLIVTIDQRLELDEDFLILTERVTRYEVNTLHEISRLDVDSQSITSRAIDVTLNPPLVIREGLKDGDRVLLLRVQGGQQYVILDKVVNL